MKQKAMAPSNIALIKYWGKKDENLRLPANGSISVNLSEIKTTTIVEFSPLFTQDTVTINHKSNPKETERVIKHLDRIRKIAKLNLKTKIETENNFPKGSGLASSASGFAALTLAAAYAARLKLSEKKLTILARLGSGSACRSIPDGFVEWVEGKDSDSSYAFSIYPKNHWDLSIIVILVKSREKKISSTEGHRLATTSPFFNTRLSNIKEKITQIKRFIKEKNFQKFGRLVENEALEMHAIMQTSTPSLIYWQPGTIEIIKFVHQLRIKGLSVYFTIDAGPHLYLICERKNERNLLKEISKIESIEKIIVNYPSDGAKIITEVR